MECIGGFLTSRFDGIVTSLFCITFFRFQRRRSSHVHLRVVRVFLVNVSDDSSMERELIDALLYAKPLVSLKLIQRAVWPSSWAVDPGR